MTSIMKACQNILKTLPFVTLSACSTWAEPPINLTSNQDVHVKFQNSDEASESCADVYEAIHGKLNSRITACAYRKTASAEPVVIMPNPCEFDDAYATLLCHELAHVNQMVSHVDVDHAGWSKQKPKGKTFARLELKGEGEMEAQEETLSTELMIAPLRGLR